MANFKASSRGEWNGDDTVANINAGSLQRIADATEKMALNHEKLIADRDLYKRWYEEQKATAKWLKNENNALRSVISRLKNERAHATAAANPLSAPSLEIMGDAR